MSKRILLNDRDIKILLEGLEQLLDEAQRETTFVTRLGREDIAKLARKLAPKEEDKR